MPIDYANYHRIALLTGCETVDDVIRWADAEIAEQPNWKRGDIGVTVAGNAEGAVKGRWTWVQ